MNHVSYETQHSKIGRCSDPGVRDYSIDKSLLYWSDFLFKEI
jgi:hypothetical protein